jgi:superkiller protein 3
MILPPDAILTLFADAYYRAAQAGAEMRTVTERLEQLRVYFKKQSEPYLIWREIDSYLGQLLEEDTIFKVFFELKQDFIQLLYQTITADIQQAFAVSEQKGWETWLHAYAQANHFWKDAIYTPLVTESFPFTEKREEFLQLFRQYAPFLAEDRWVEGMPIFAYLAQAPELSKELRAEFWLTCGQIQLYHLLDSPAAYADFEKAQALAPGLSRVARSFGEYHLQENQLEPARSFLQKALQLDDSEVENYLYLGDLEWKAGKQTLALQWYQDGLKKNPGDVNAYFRLIRLNGNPTYEKNTDAKIADIRELVQTVARLDPPVAYAAYLEAGAACLGIEQVEKAADWYQQAITLQPERTTAYQYLGYLYRDQEQPEQAIEWFEKLLAVDAENFDAHWELGWIYHKTANWQAALAHFEKSLPLRESWKRFIQSAIGEVYLNLANYSAAENHLLQALEADPTDESPTGTLHRLVETYAASGNRQAAMQLLEKMYTIKGTAYTAEYHNRLGILYYENNEFETAVQHYQKALTLRPDDAIQNENIGLAYEQWAHWEEAQRAYEQALRCAAETDKHIYLNRLGVFHFNRQEYEPALDYYRKAIAQAPQSVYYQNVALVYETLGQPQEAIEAYEQASTLAPDDWTLYNIIGNLRYRNGDFAGAIPVYQKAAALSPGVAYNHENLGLAYEKTGQFAQAEAAYEKALEAAFDNEKALYYNRLGIFYYNQGQTEKAVDFYRQALQSDGKNSIYYENLGLAYEQTYQYAEAEQAYLQAVDHATAKDLYYNRLGILYLKYDPARAQESFEEAIALNPNVALYYDNIAFLFEQQQQWDKAIVAYERAAALEPQNPLYHDRIGNVLVAADRPAEALPWYEKAMRLEPANATTLNNLLFAVDRLTDKTPALPILQDLKTLPEVNQSLIEQKLTTMQANLSDTQPNAISET